MIVKEELKLSAEWDKTFPKSEKVGHSKVTFVNRYGITLAADLYAPKNAEGKLPAMSLMDEVDDYDFGCGLSRKLLLYDDFCAANYVRYSRGSQLLRDQGEEPLMFVQKNQRGGITAELDTCAAIPKSSENKANAWRLLKILLSDEIQGGHDKEVYNNSYFFSGFPARLSATKAAIDKGFTMSPKGPVFDEYVALVQSPTEATLVPQAYRQIMDEEIMPYIRGEKTWDDCYMNLVESLEVYRKSK